MPAEVIPQPTATSPDKPPRRPRKGAKPPAAPKVVRHREKPARTLRVRLAELSPHHVEAFDLVAKHDDAFAESIRFALTARDTVEFATRRLVAAQNAVGEAETVLAAAKEADARGSAALARLSAKAVLVAQLHDDAPESDEDFGPLDPGAVPGDAT